MVELKERDGKILRFKSLRECAEYLLKTGYKYIKKLSELPLKTQKEYFYLGKPNLPAIRKTKAGYIQVVVEG